MKPRIAQPILSTVRRQKQRLLSYSRPIAASSSTSVPSDSHNTSLHQLFDSPLSDYVPSSHHSLLSPQGLFLQPALTKPSDFPELASKTTLRAKLLVERICSTHSNSTALPDIERDFLGIVKNLDRLSDTLCGVIDLAELVRNVHPDKGWNDGANQAYEDLCAYMNELNTNVGLYEGLKALYSRLPPSTPSKSPELFAAYAVATPFLRDFEKSGIHLPSQQRTQFVDLSSEILQLGRKFLQNAAEPRPSIHVRSDEVAEAFGEPFAKRLFEDQEGGMIDPGSWEGRVMARQHPSSDLRKRLYIAANSSPDSSHVEVLEDLLRKRAELAKLVGRESWGEVVLEDKMAQAPQNVMSFLDALNLHNRPLAEKDLAVLRQTKRTFGRGEDASRIEAWDRDYYSDLSNQRPSGLPDLSPFFSVGSCFVGLSKLFERLYGIRFEPEEIQHGEVWEPSVRKLKVVDEDEGRIGTIYCDLFAREGKQAGAAHYTVRCSRRVDDDDAETDFRGNEFVDLANDGGRVYRGDQKGLLHVPQVEWSGRQGRFQEPIVVLVCGFGQEGDWQNGTTFLQWHEVETLFHEMGHAIHSMIGRTSYHNVSGTRCATDFVELPSILMEHFVTSPSVLDLFALHPNTSRPIPRSILDQLLQDRQRFSALETSSQIMMASLDQSYHTDQVLNSRFSSSQELKRINDQFHVIPSPREQDSDWQLTFGHLFGYGATYYSYLFDRAIAAKVFSNKFAEDPLSREKGEELKKKLLRWGGGKEPWEMVGEVVGDEGVMKGGEDAMKTVGQWGIEEAKQGK